ncbi:hypothetical protein M409DRAFT_53830 [Zasmidium cellare ATCC 36951]|uniref:Rhodopsin domain-containing protein n=1 Tax=Zasmidium cellare ATCC 36951 TaxID=1080233 RepID=A0A6A6CQ32_ZASCE|nr:uncharacterized protein M409DRAFT_53830 [Zasmidium cellare ATCC 36951]KAF2167879.1 hypothetical protein M409DRAFT_53830 [Zasmidium cellare ATCC 36951]
MTVGRTATLAVNITFFILSWLSVGLRILVRAGMLRAFGSDDWTMLATQVFFTGYLIAQLGGVIYGTGEHLSDLIPWRAERALAFWYFCEIFYTLSTCLLKISVGLFLLRVAGQKLHIWIIRLVMLFAAVFGGAFFFVIVFQCWPISNWWDLDPSHKNCINPDIVIGLTYGISALNVVADWTLGLLPIFIVRGLQMSTRQKRLVAIILSFAAIGSTATIVRLPYIGSLSESFDGWNGDFLYNTVGVAIWTTVEVGVGITAGCLATLRPLIRMAFDRLGVGSSSNRKYRPSGGQPHSRSRMTPSHRLDEFAPGHGHTITTITGNRGETVGKTSRSRSSSQEQLASPSGKIMKQFVVEYDDDGFGEEAVTALPKR